MTDTATAIRLARRTTDQVVGVGDTRGWERPSEYQSLVALDAAAKAAQRDSAPRPVPPPTDPGKVGKFLDDVAQSTVFAAARRQAADQLVVEVERQIAVLGAPIAADYVPRLVGEFAEHVAAYQALADAPRELTGHEDPEQTAAHLQLLRLASQLTADLGDRGTLAIAFGEAEDIGRALVWLVLSPGPDVYVGAVDEALRTFNASIPRTPADWDSLLPLGLTLAGPGEVLARRERHGTALWNRGMGPDGGLGPDMTYGEVAQRAGQPGQLQAEANRVFANTPPLAV